MLKRDSEGTCRRFGPKRLQGYVPEFAGKQNVQTQPLLPGWPIWLESG